MNILKRPLIFAVVGVLLPSFIMAIENDPRIAYHGYPGNSFTRKDSIQEFIRKSLDQCPYYNEGTEAPGDVTASVSHMLHSLKEAIESSTIYRSMSKTTSAAAAPINRTSERERIALCLCGLGTVGLAAAIASYGLFN